MEPTARRDAIITIIGLAMALSNDHPQDAPLWISSAVGALEVLGVTELDLAEGLKAAPFVSNLIMQIALRDVAEAKA